MKYIFLIQGSAQFGIGVIDLYLDYDKFTFLWLITGVLFIVIGLFFALLDKLELIHKQKGESDEAE